MAKSTSSNFDLGAAAEMMPQIALSDVRPSGTLSAVMDVKRLDTDDPRSAAGTAADSRFFAPSTRATSCVCRPAPRRFRSKAGKLEMPALALEVSTPRGPGGELRRFRARLEKLGQGAEIDATFGMRPLPLATVLGMVSRVERAEGMLSGKLQLHGPLGGAPLPRWFRAEQRRGSAARPGDAAQRHLGRVGGRRQRDQHRARHGAHLGSGTLAIRGGAPLHGFEIGGASVAITGRNLSMPSTNGIHAVADADLLATFQSARDGATERTLPRLTGNVTLKSFEYKRPVMMTADISSLTQRGKRTEFEAYDPNDDALDLDIRILSERPLKLQNNLVEAELLLDEQGLELWARTRATAICAATSVSSRAAASRCGAASSRSKKATSASTTSRASRRAST